MKRLIVLPLLLVLSCAFTPQSIQQISTVQLDLIRALQQDMRVIVADYDYELKVWVVRSFERAMREIEEDMVDENGMVNLAEYKEAAGAVSVQMNSVLDEYTQNKLDIENAIEAKFAKALILQTMIQRFEQSTGTSPETVAAFVQEYGNATSEIYQAYKAAHPDETDPNSIKNRLQLIGQGMADKIFERATTEIESGAFLDTNPFNPNRENNNEQPN